MRKLPFVCAALAACLPVEKIPTGNAKSLIWILRDAPDLIFVAEDVENAQQTPVSADLEVLLYDSPLAELLLPTGILKPASHSTGRPLPTPDAVLRTQPDGSLSPGTISAEALAFRLSGGALDACQGGDRCIDGDTCSHCTPTPPIPPTPPEPPEPPQLPDLQTCTSPFIGSDTGACLPPVISEPCPTGQYPFLDTCRAVLPVCGTDPWSTLVDPQSHVFVTPDAPEDGVGTRESPFSFTRALASKAPKIALAPGSYPAANITRSVSLTGACSGVRLAPLQVSAEAVVLSNLELEKLEVRPEATATVDHLVIGHPERVISVSNSGVIRGSSVAIVAGQLRVLGGTVELDDASMMSPEPENILLAEPSGLTPAQVTLRRTRATVLGAYVLHGTLRLEQSYARLQPAGTCTAGICIAKTRPLGQPRLELEGSTLESNEAVCLFSIEGTFKASHSTILGGADACLELNSLTTAEIDGAVFEAPKTAIHLRSSRLDMNDTSILANIALASDGSATASVSHTRFSVGAFGVRSTIEAEHAVERATMTHLEDVEIVRNSSSPFACTGVDATSEQPDASAVIALRRVTVRNCGVGLQAKGAGAVIDAEDVTIGTTSRGIRIFDDASVRGRRIRMTGLTSGAVESKVESGRGTSIVDLADLSATDFLLDDCAAAALGFEGVTQLVLRRVLLDSRAPESLRMEVDTPGDLTVEDMDVVSSPGYFLRLEDGPIRGTLARVRSSRVSEVGMSVKLDKSLQVTDLEMAFGPSQSTCAARTAESIAIATTSLGSIIDLSIERFHISQLHDRTLDLDPLAQVRLKDGLVTHARVGIQPKAPGIELTQLMEGVHFEDVGQVVGLEP